MDLAKFCREGVWFAIYEKMNIVLIVVIDVRSLVVPDPRKAKIFKEPVELCGLWRHKFNKVDSV
jgi:hypothetical protein